MHVNIGTNTPVIHPPRFPVTEGTQGQDAPESKLACRSAKAAAPEPAAGDCLRLWGVTAVVPQGIMHTLRRTTLNFSERAPGGRGDLVSATNLRLPIAQLPGLPGEVSIGRSLGMTVLGLDCYLGAWPLGLAELVVRNFYNINFGRHSLGILMQVHLSDLFIRGCSLGLGLSICELRQQALIASAGDNLTPKRHLWLKSRSCSSSRLTFFAGLGTPGCLNLGLKGRLGSSRFVELTVQRRYSPLEAVTLHRYAACPWRQRLRQTGALLYRILPGASMVGDLVAQVADLNVGESLRLSRAQAPKRQWTRHVRAGLQTGTRLQRLSAGSVDQDSKMAQVHYHLRQADHALWLTVVEKVQNADDQGHTMPMAQRSQVSLASCAFFVILRLPLAAGDLKAAARGEGTTAPVAKALQELLNTLEASPPRSSQAPVATILAWQAQHQHLGIECMGQGRHEGTGNSRRIEGHIPVLNQPGSRRARRTVQQHSSQEQQVLAHGSYRDEEDTGTMCTLLELDNGGQMTATSRVQRKVRQVIAAEPAAVVAPTTIYSCALWLEKPLLREVNRLCLQPLATTLGLRPPPTTGLDHAAAQLHDSDRRCEASLELDVVAIKALWLALRQQSHLKFERDPELLDHFTTQPLRELFCDLYAEAQAAGTDDVRACRALQDRLEQFFLPKSLAANKTLIWTQLRVLSILAQLTNTVEKGLYIACFSALEHEQGTAVHSLRALVSDLDAIAQPSQLYAGAAHLLPQALSAWHRQQLGFIVGQQQTVLPRDYRRPNQQDARQEEPLRTRLTEQGASLVAALDALTVRLELTAHTSRSRDLKRLHDQLLDAETGSDPVNERVLLNMVDDSRARIHLDETQGLVRAARRALRQVLERYLSRPTTGQQTWYRRWQWQPRDLITDGLAGVASVWLPRWAVEDLMRLGGRGLTLVDQSFGRLLLAWAAAQADLDI